MAGWLFLHLSCFLSPSCSTVCQEPCSCPHSWGLSNKSVHTPFPGSHGRPLFRCLPCPSLRPYLNVDPWYPDHDVSALLQLRILILSQEPGGPCSPGPTSPSLACNNLCSLINTPAPLPACLFLLPVWHGELLEQATYPLDGPVTSMVRSQAVAKAEVSSGWLSLTYAEIRAVSSRCTGLRALRALRALRGRTVLFPEWFAIECVHTERPGQPCGLRGGQ